MCISNGTLGMGIPAVCPPVCQRGTPSRRASLPPHGRSAGGSAHTRPDGTGIFCPQDAFLLPMRLALPRGTRPSWVSAGGEEGEEPIGGAGEAHPPRHPTEKERLCDRADRAYGGRVCCSASWWCSPGAPMT